VHSTKKIYSTLASPFPCTVAVKKTFPFLFVPFLCLQNGAGTDCKREHHLLRSVSFPAVVYCVRQYALYCGMKAITTDSEALSKFVGRATRGQLTGGYLQATEDQFAHHSYN
jgi:hypothetical protein